MTSIAKTLMEIDFKIMSEEENRISLNYGYTKEGYGEKVYHLHLSYKGDNDELYFRDYLNEHLNLAKIYEEKKLETEKAKNEYKDRY